jgi:hypothetical protein
MAGHSQTDPTHRGSWFAVSRAFTSAPRSISSRPTFSDYSVNFKGVLFW